MAYMLLVPVAFDCSSPNILSISEVLGRLAWDLAPFKRDQEHLCVFRSQHLPLL